MSGPGPVRPPPRSASKALREADQRARAIPVYRVLVEAHEHQPPHLLTWAEIVKRAGLFNLDEAIGAVQWMRSKGVAIFVAPGESPGEPAVVALHERLPEAFEPSGP